jgi:hypothetical protein
MSDPTCFHPRYRPGQRWIYKAPPGQEDSRVVILQIEKTPEIGTIVHLSVESLRIPAPRIEGGFVTELMHLPFQLESFERELIAEDADRFGAADFPNAGYEAWQANRGGAWNVPIGDVVKMMAGFYSED